MKKAHRIRIFTLLLVFVGFAGVSQGIRDAEVKQMIYLLEEEKMAHDVYAYFEEIWTLRIFSHIRQSEQRHMEQMENLLALHKARYKLSNSRGVFYDAALQELYDNLTERGEQSIKEALHVGKLIEETDIRDLEKAMENTTDVYSKEVYQNLLRASQNHLKAFNRQLQREHSF